MQERFCAFFFLRKSQNESLYFVLQDNIIPKIIKGAVNTSFFFRFFIIIIFFLHLIMTKPSPERK
jgi:hypothetical protein